MDAEHIVVYETKRLTVIYRLVYCVSGDDRINNIRAWRLTVFSFSIAGQHVARAQG